MANYSEKFSFDSPADIFSPDDPLNLYKTSFIKERVTEAINQHLTANKAIVSTFIHPGFKKECFKLTFYFNQNILGELLGDFPCPDQCVPPALEDHFNNTFDIIDISEVVTQDLCVYLNIRLALNNKNTSLEYSTCIYGVITSSGNLVEKRNNGDKVFISNTSSK